MSKIGINKDLEEVLSDSDIQALLDQMEDSCVLQWVGPAREGAADPSGCAWYIQRSQVSYK